VSHTGPGGQPDGWMSRAAYLWAMVGSELAIMAPLVLLSLSLARTRGRSWSIPHKEYWLAPERRAETIAHLQGQLLWLAVLLQVGMMVLWQAGIDSNVAASPVIPGSFLFKIAVVGAVVLVWLVRYGRRFHAPPDP